MNETQNPERDELAHASAVPQIGALITEFTQAQTDGVCRLNDVATAENVRYNRWPGKSPTADGRRWQAHSSDGKPVTPYDGRPDCEIHLPDEICQAEVDVLMTAHRGAQFGAMTTHVTPLSAAKVAEMRAVAKWCKGAIAEDERDAAELLAQMVTELGWSVINPGWRKRYELVIREVRLPQLLIEVARLLGPPAAQQLGLMIQDPTQETPAVEAVQQLFAHLPKHRARQMVQEWRTQGEATFLDRTLVENRPTLRTLVQGYDYFISGGGGAIQRARGHLVVERFYQADIEALATSNDWHAEFVERAVATAGQYSAYSEGQREKQARDKQDATDLSIEIWTTTVLQFDPETGAAGFYCTTFSPHVQPAAGEPVTEAHYAAHYLLDYAHGRAPFIQARREVIGPALTDSRGVPELVQSDQQVIKTLTDATVARAHLEVDPPLALTGGGWSKMAGGLKPGARHENTMPGTDVKPLVASRGDARPAEVAIERLAAATHRRFALPNTRDGSHPSAWQMRQTRNTARWLATWSEVYTQLVILAYQKLSPWELGQILGRPPRLTVDEIVHHRITLKYDVRALDTEWTQTVLDFLVRLLGIDRGAQMDTSAIITIALPYIDPALVEQVMHDPGEASAALYRRVEQEVGSMMQGNPPQLIEGDASAWMQMQMAFAVLGKNPRYQEILRRDPQVQEHLKTWLQNRQHNVQETQISPQQGRLGVAGRPQQPVRQGNLMQQTDGGMGGQP